MRIQIKDGGCLIMGAILSVILLILKIIGVGIPWWIVLLPYIVALIFILGFLLVFVVPVLIGVLRAKKKEEEESD